MLNKVFSPGYFAREDTKTPMKFATVGLLINVALSVLLFPMFQHVGIALATTIAGWINTGLLVGVLWHRGHFSPNLTVLRKIALILLASLVMGGVIHLVSGALHPYLTGGGLLTRLAALGGLVLIGMATFAVVAQVTGGSNLVAHAKSFRRRK